MPKSIHAIFSQHAYHSGSERFIRYTGASNVEEKLEGAYKKINASDTHIYVSSEVYKMSKMNKTKSAVVKYFFLLCLGNEMHVIESGA